MAVQTEELNSLASVTEVLGDTSEEKQEYCQDQEVENNLKTDLCGKALNFRK